VSPDIRKPGTGLSNFPLSFESQQSSDHPDSSIPGKLTAFGKSGAGRFTESPGRRERERTAERPGIGPVTFPTSFLLRQAGD
jgi:hypothetical protein